ncbi:hypothetical protein [Shewanella surugensis]|uniref:Uncharacterized protein n=1 Tax=Shewanella surugensis TaxID=212020 RepID=A0ABT0LAH1_9GAMM|nr:hypothetical protein [Shewanella surugensis]MCL1124485.1 hypothetical protein [Shewanella surugensis]
MNITNSVGYNSIESLRAVKVSNESNGQLNDRVTKLESTSTISISDEAKKLYQLSVLADKSSDVGPLTNGNGNEPPKVNMDKLSIAGTLTNGNGNEPP